MGDGEVKNPALLHLLRETRGGIFDPDVDPATDEPKRRVPQQGPWEQTGLYQNLEPVAYPQHREPLVGDRGYSSQRRTPRRDRTRPQVVAEGEPAGEDHRVVVRNRCVLVPDQVGLHVVQGPERLQSVEVAVAPGEPYDGDLCSDVVTPRP